MAKELSEVIKKEDIFQYFDKEIWTRDLSEEQDAIARKIENDLLNLGEDE